MNLLLFCFVCFFMSVPAAFAQICEEVFEFSGRSFKQPAIQQGRQDSRLHPEFRDPIAEQQLSTQWDKAPENVPPALNMFLPEGVHFIHHQLPLAESATSVKLKEVHSSMMVRASYEYKGQTRHTNVLFSSRAILNNIYNPREKWLVSPSAQAVILFLHGMGTQSAGAHTVKHTIRHFKNYKKLEFISLDLPFHGEGPRAFLGSLKEEVLALSAFAQKYIPPNVPLFVMAQSGGTVFAQKIMSMTDGPQGPKVFHPGLKGIMLFSPIADPTPGKSPIERQKAFSQGQKKGLKAVETLETETDNLFSLQHFESLNPVGELYGMWNISQWEGKIPAHGGSKYVPTLMAVGTGDPLVYTGFSKKLFQDYYDQLSNIETHYLEELPNFRTKKIEKVGHWLGEYKDPETDQALITALAVPFIEKHISDFLSIKKHPPPPPFIQAIELFSHDLSFRYFLQGIALESADTSRADKQIESANKTSLSQHRNKARIIARRNPELGQKLGAERKRLQSFFDSKIPFIPNGKTRRKIKSLTNKILGANSPEQARQYITQMDLEENLLNELHRVIISSPYFDLKNLNTGLYLPSKKDLLNRGLISSADEMKVDSYLSEIDQNIKSRILLKQEIKALNDKKAQLIEKQKTVQEEVKTAILRIEGAINNASKEWPHLFYLNDHLSEAQLYPKWPLALRKSFSDLKVKRDQAQLARAQLIEAFEEIAPQLFLQSATQELASTSRVNAELSALKRLLSSHQDIIDQDHRAYRSYQQARQNVRRQVLQAILQGELITKNEFLILQDQQKYNWPQEAIDRHKAKNNTLKASGRSLHGLFLQGTALESADTSRVGMKQDHYMNQVSKEPQGELYVKLKAINQELAEVESAVYQKTALLDQVIQEYQVLLAQLYSLFFLQSADLEVIPTLKAGKKPRTFTNKIYVQPLEGDGLDIIALASTAYRFYNVPEVLQGINKESEPLFSANTSTPSHKDKTSPVDNQMEWLQDYNHTFQEILRVYQKEFHSDLMPSF